MPFDLEQLEVTGQPVTIVEDLMMEPGGAAHFALSDNGALVYVPGGMLGTDRKLVWVDREGEATPVPVPSRPYMEPSLSPDGERVAVTIPEGSNYEVWIAELVRGVLTRLTFHPGEDLGPIWSRDGKRITFRSEMAETAPQLFETPADGSGTPESMYEWEQTSSQTPGSYSSDALVFAGGPGSTGDRGIWVLPLEDNGKPILFLQTEFHEYSPMFSPDGGWITYVSDESGRAEVYARPYPGPGEKWQISTEGGTEPVWASNGRELFYRNGNKMMAVVITTEPVFNAGKPRLLFEKRYAVTNRPDAPRNYDISPDGQRFLMVKREQDVIPTELIVVLNWFEELKRLVPTN